jgi:HlyD family secretion protein
MKSLTFYLTFTLAGILFSCRTGGESSDAYGNFEAVEITVSSEGSGKIMRFNLEEGAQLKAGEIVGYIDTVQLSLKKAQLRAAIKALYSKVPDVAPQINVLTEQLATARNEKSRIENLVKSGAATTKQLDDVNAQIQLIERRITATKSKLSTQSKGILAEIEPLNTQIRQLDDSIRKSLITNPIDGTVLSKFAEAWELAGPGKPLYKIADISRIILRAYISGEQLSQVKIGQSVRVLIDAPQGAYLEYAGTVTWVADKAEFAPKIVQTKDERVNLVYAIKVLVQNDGRIKIGMPGEVRLNAE